MKIRRRFWTAAEDRTLRKHYPHKATADVVKLLPGRTERTVYQRAGTLGLHKTPAYLASPAACRLRRDSSIGAPYRFKKGMTPWNLGKRGYMGANRTSFRKGNYSARWDREIYCIGALRINTDGGLDIKVREGLRAWEALPRYVWRTERGRLPKGAIVRPINGDPHDTRIENLRLATRADLMRENTYHRYPKEIARLIQLRGALQRQINKREGKHEQHNS